MPQLSWCLDASAALRTVHPILKGLSYLLQIDIHGIMCEGAKDISSDYNPMYVYSDAYRAEIMRNYFLVDIVQDALLHLGHFLREIIQWFC